MIKGGSRGLNCFKYLISKRSYSHVSKQFARPFGVHPGSECTFEQAFTEIHEKFNPKHTRGVVCVGETTEMMGETAGRKSIIIFTSTSSRWDSGKSEIPKEYKGHPVIHVAGVLSGMGAPFDPMD
jgi:hypothetical protein